MPQQTDFNADFLWIESGEYVVKDVISSDYDFHDYVQTVVHNCRRRKFDNITLITAAREGLGKSVLWQSLAQNITKLHHDLGDPVPYPWDWRANTVFYDWDLFAPRYNAPTPYLVVAVDEAFEFLFSRNSPAAAQKRMVQDLVIGRFMKKHAGICGGNLLWFDSIVRAHKAHHWIHLVVFDVREDGLVHEEVRYAYLLERHFGDWPSRRVQWDALGYLEYGLPVPDWFIPMYDGEKLRALQAYREVLKLGRGKRRGRERAVCEGWGENICERYGPVQVIDGKKLCFLCQRRAQSAAAKIEREMAKLGAV